MDNVDTLFEVKLEMKDKYKDLLDFYLQISSIVAVVLFVGDTGKQIGMIELFISIILGKTFYELVVKRIVVFI